MTIAEPSFLRLTYFDIRGRAEPARLLLEDCGAAYQDERIVLSAWGKLKDAVPFGQLPLLAQDDLLVPKSQAICRHLARRFQLYGQDEQQRTTCDVLQELFVDCNNELLAVLASPKWETLRPAFCEEHLARTLTRLTSTLHSHGRSPAFWVGDRRSYIDYQAWSYLDLVRAFAPELLARFSALQQFKLAFEERPGVAAYLRSGRRPATFFMPWFPFGGTAATS